MTQVLSENQLKAREDTLYSSHMDEINNDGVILKLYESFLSNPRVQKGIKRLEKISQPIIEKYHEYVDENLLRVKHKLSDWVSHVNVYTHLVGLWFLQNVPHDGNVVTKEKFTNSLLVFDKTKSPKDIEVVSGHFYDAAAAIWLKLKSPSKEDIRTAMLHAVARTISKTITPENDSFAPGLVTIFQNLTEHKRELVTEDSYVALVRTYVGFAAWKERENEFVSAAKEFYTFAKRFLLVDYPISNTAGSAKDLIVTLVKEKTSTYKNLVKERSAKYTNFVVDNASNYSNLALDKVDGGVEALYEYFGLESMNFEDKNLTVMLRSKRIMHKCLVLMGFLFQMATNRIQKTSLYIKLDEHVHFESSANDIKYLMQLAWSEVLVPSVEYFTFKKDQIKDKIVVTFKELGSNQEKIKKRFLEAKAKFSVLARCTAILKDDVLEIVLNKDEFNQAKTNVQAQLVEVYKELKAMNPKAVKAIGMSLYEKCIQKMKKTYAIASGENEEVKMEQPEVKEEVEPVEVRSPAEEKPVEEFEEQSQPEGGEGEAPTKPEKKGGKKKGGKSK